MPEKRCQIMQDGETIADAEVEATNEATAQNAALAKAQGQIDRKRCDEENPCEYFCE